MNKIVIQTWLIFQLLLTGLIIIDSPAMAQSGKKLKKIMVDQGQFDPNLKGIHVLEGFRAETVALNPVVVNPSLISFSDDGKIFVLQRSPNFTGEWKASKWPLGKDNQGVSLKKPFPDKIITLRIDVKSGAWKHDKTVLEPNSPSSFVVHPPYLYLAESGTITRFKIKDDGSIDIKAENILKGCAGFYEYQLGGLCFGPDGWLYFHFPPEIPFWKGLMGPRLKLSEPEESPAANLMGKNLKFMQPAFVRLKEISLLMRRVTVSLRTNKSLPAKSLLVCGCYILPRVLISAGILKTSLSLSNQIQIKSSTKGTMHRSPSSTCPRCIQFHPMPIPM